MKDFADQGALQAHRLRAERHRVELRRVRIDLGTVDGTLYGFLFKAANKSTVWYNVQAFSDAGVEPPEEWDAFLENASTLAASGVPAYSIGGADGWTLTDLFENIYLRTAGPDKYDQLAAHEIPWTDQTVKDALAEMAKVVGDPDNIAGGTDGALQTDFPTSVSQVYADPPSRRPGDRGRLRRRQHRRLDERPARPTTSTSLISPSIGDTGDVIVGGGDTLIMFKDSPAAEALIKYLTTPEAAQIWAEKGGFGSLNKNLDPSVYPDEITQTTAGSLSTAEVFRFDLSDLQPAEFGGTVGQGLFEEFQDFLANPDDVNGVTREMEKSAAQAYGG